MSAATPSTLSVSAVVLTHRRIETLRRTLDSLRSQSVGELQVIVVDNGSGDETATVVAREYPEAELIALPENTGVRGRNIGLEAATGDLVISLDDDIELLDPLSIERVRAHFAREAELGAATLKIVEADSDGEYAEAHWWHPRPRDLWQDRCFETNTINEAAVVFRRAALRDAGYYYEALFWGGEEWDLVLALIDCGQRVRYVPEPVLHLAPRGNINTQASPRHVLLLRNRCWVAFRRLPLPQALAFALPRLALWGVRSLRYGYVSEYCRGIAALLRAMPIIMRERRPVSRETRARLRAIRRASAEPSA